MAILLDDLTRAASRRTVELAKSVSEARTRGVKTAFLCHSHRDAMYVEGVVTLLRETGWNVYIDWQDATMPATPSRETARNIKLRIEQANWFLFLATPNSTASRWCPWEIGYADGVKDIEQVLVIPTRDTRGNYYGNEYLSLYRRVDLSKQGPLAAWHPGIFEGGTFVKNL